MSVRGIQVLLALASEFARIDEQAKRYASHDSAVTELADGDKVMLAMFRTLIERAFLMGYHAAVLEAVARIEREEQERG